MAGRDTRRVNRGSGHRYLLDGEDADGVTTVIGDGYPKPALINWAANTTAGWAVDHWDDLALMTPSQRLKTLQGARFAERDAAAARGTQIHDLAHRLAGGEAIDVPDALAGHVDSYLAFADDFGVEEMLAEVVVVNRRWRYMGTLDLVACLRGSDDPDQVWLLDFKTGASGIWPETALQLAAYAHAESYLDRQGVEVPLPPVDRGGAVWLRADGYDLHPVDVSEATFRAFLYVQQVAQFQRGRRDAVIGEALRAQEVARP